MQIESDLEARGIDTTDFGLFSSVSHPWRSTTRPLPRFSSNGCRDRAVARRPRASDRSWFYFQRIGRWAARRLADNQLAQRRLLAAAKLHPFEAASLARRAHLRTAAQIPISSGGDAVAADPPLYRALEARRARPPRIRKFSRQRASYPCDEQAVRDLLREAGRLSAGLGYPAAGCGRLRSLVGHRGRRDHEAWSGLSVVAGRSIHREPRSACSASLAATFATSRNLGDPSLR